MSPLRRLCWSACVVSGVGLLAEGAARRVDPQLPAWRSEDHPAVVMTGHPERLWGLSPGVRDNAGTTATINELGLRGRVPTFPRPEGRERILVVGDSSFFGFGVGDDDTLDVTIVENLARGGLDVDGVNGGVPGYSTEQIRLLLDDVGWPTDPTLLIVGALWSDTNFEPFTDRDLLRSSAFSAHPLARSSAVRLLATGLTRWFRPNAGRIVTWTRTAPLPEARHRRVALGDYANNLIAIALEAKRRGIGVAFVSPAASVEIEQTPDTAYQWDAYRSVQSSVAAHLGVPWVDARISFGLAEKPPMGPALFLDDLHPTPAGVDHLAKAIVSMLTDAGWPTDRLLPRPGTHPLSIGPDPHDGRPLPAEERVMSPLDNLFGSGNSLNPGR